MSELESIEEKTEEALTHEENVSKREGIKIDQARVQEERTSLLDSIKEDLRAISKCKSQIRELKDQDVKLAADADTLTDKEMAMLDMKRITLHNERKEKRKSMSFGFLGDYNQGGKPTNANLKMEYKTRVGDDLPTIE